jgi:hypothetical protein
VLTDAAALQRLETLIGGGDATASSYWRTEIQTFTIDAAGVFGGISVLGSLTPRRGPLYAALHWLLQAPYRRIGARFAAFPEALRAGCLVAERQGRQLTEDMLRQVLIAALARDLVPEIGKDEAVAVIGDGFGVLAALHRLLRPAHKVIAVNLTKSLLLDLVQIGKAVPGDGFALAEDEAGLAAALAAPGVRIVGIRADDARLLARAPVGLAFNVESMQEMDPPVIAAYFAHLRTCPATRTFFYCCNRAEKRLYDGTVVRFDEYPWRAGDRRLLDEACPWNRFSYSTRPPFYSFRPLGAVRHRLIEMEKGA